MENELTFRLQQRQSLPVFNYRQQILEQIRKHNVILIRGATGCGKTTQVFQFTILFFRNFFFFYLKIPQYIIDDAIEHNQGTHCNVVVTQPRRISTISIAERVCWGLFLFFILFNFNEKIFLSSRTM